MTNPRVTDLHAKAMGRNEGGSLTKAAALVSTMCHLSKLGRLSLVPDVLPTCTIACGMVKLLK